MHYNMWMLLVAQLEIGRILFPVLVGMAGVALLIGVAMAVRKRLLKSDDSMNDPAAGFSMGSLRQLVREGKMSQAEYDAAKARIVAGAQRIADTQALSPDLARGRRPDAANAGTAKIIEQKPPIDEHL